MTDPTTPDTLTAAAERAEATTSEWIEVIGLVLDSEAALCDRPGQMARLERAARDLRAIASRLPAPTPAVDREDGAALIAAERHRVVSVKGYTPEHDDQHVHGELLDAAYCYANQGRTWFPEHARKYGTDRFSVSDQGWPWWTGHEPQGWKPSADPIEMLTKAGQFLAAEIDRLKRVEKGGVRDGG